MKNLEPKIFRQRLTIEAKYAGFITRKMIKEFFYDFSEKIKMTPISKLIIVSPNKTNHPVHHGIGGFMAWAESGCSVYTWDRFNFLTVEIYTCKKFDVPKAVDFVKKYFDCNKVVFRM